MTLDCRANSAACPELKVQGDSPAGGFFHGYADPSIRLDPNSGAIYMSYSYPRHLSGPRANIVDIHLARSTDSGKTWNYLGPLFQGRTVVNQQASYAAQSTTSNEVLDILPVNRNGSTVWYTARLVYLVGNGQTFPYMQFLNTSYLSIVVAPSNRDLPNLAKMKEMRLGHPGLDPGLQPNLNIGDLDPALQNCRFLNEPSLTYQNGTLYLATSCNYGVANPMNPQRARLDSTRDFFALLATKPVGDDPTAWRWRYVGGFAGNADARLLGQQEGREYSSFTQLEFVRKPGGSLLAILTPQAVGSGARGQGQQNHFGCRAFEMDPDLEHPALAKNTSGILRMLAAVNASDLYGGSNRGSGSCSYDPASVTGIVIARRYVRDPVEGFVTSLHITGLHP